MMKRSSWVSPIDLPRRPDVTSIGAWGYCLADNAADTLDRLDVVAVSQLREEAATERPSLAAAVPTD